MGVNQRGIAWLPLIPYIVGALAFVGAATFVYQYVDNNWATDAGIAEGRKREHADLQPKIDELEKWKADAITAGEKAEQEKLAKEADDKKRKEESDAENAKTRRDLAGVYDAYRKLRDSRSAGSGGLSAPSPSAASPDRTCFDPAKLGAALRRLDEGVLGIAETGDKAIADLDTAKRWAQR